MLPHIYEDATVRNITPVCQERHRVGFGFDVPGQPTVRVALTLEGAGVLMSTLACYISAFAGSQRPDPDQQGPHQ